MLTDVVKFVALEAAAGGRHRDGATRHLGRAIAAAGATGPTRQCPDFGKGVDLGLDAIRGLGILRQADARPPRSLEPALELGDAQQLRAPAKCHLAGVLRRPCSSASRPGPSCSWSWPDCPRSWRKRNSPARRFAYSAGAPPKRGCRSIWNPCWRAKTTPRKSSCSNWDRACWIATGTFSRACIARTVI